MANFINGINCCNTEHWVDVKPAEGTSEEESTCKVVVNYPGGQATSHNLIKTNQEALVVHFVPY